MIIIGSVFLILGNLPFGISDWLTAHLGKNFGTYMGYPVNATFNMMGLIAVFGIAYRLAEAYEIDGVTAGIISLCAFLLAAPFGTLKEAVQGGTDGIPVALLGSKGLFIAMIIGLGATEIYRWFIKKEFVIKMPEGVPPAVSKSFVALFPGFVVITLVFLLRILVEQTHFGNLFNVVGDLLGGPLGALGTSLWGSVLAEILVTLLWICGLHGSNIVGGVMAPIWYGAAGDNAAAFAHHQPLPHVITQSFYDIFVNMGGSGATFMLVILFVLFAKSQQNKAIGKIAIGPAIFEINEPVIFGTPIVLNPMLVIPFILAPVCNVITTYLAMDWGLVAKTTGTVIPWTTPPIISGFLATNSWTGSAMQVFNLIMDFFIYLPFFMMWDKQLVSQEKGIDTTKQAS
jgi:PTS system cellobiose-specific IIC component